MKLTSGLRFARSCLIRSQLSAGVGATTTVTAKRRALALCLIVVAALLIAGCGDEVAIGVGPSPVDYVRRARDFVSLAMITLAEGRALWGQSIRAMYYAAYTLARSKPHYAVSSSGRDGHELTWQQAPKKARKFFRDTLRPLRNKWDYDVLPPPDEPVDEDLKTLATEGPDAFAALLADVRDTVAPEQHKCSKNPASCSYCRLSQISECPRAQIDAAVDDLQHELGCIGPNWPKPFPRQVLALLRLGRALPNAG